MFQNYYFEQSKNKNRIISCEIFFSFQDRFFSLVFSPDSDPDMDPQGGWCGSRIRIRIQIWIHREVDADPESGSASRYGSTGRLMRIQNPDPQLQLQRRQIRITGFKLIFITDALTRLLPNFWFKQIYAIKQQCCQLLHVKFTFVRRYPAISNYFIKCTGNFLTFLYAYLSLYRTSMAPLLLNHWTSMAPLL